MTRKKIVMSCGHKGFVDFKVHAGKDIFCISCSKIVKIVFVVEK